MGGVLTCCAEDLGIQRRERFGLAALEADVDLGDAFCRQLDERGILDDMGEQSFALAVRRGRISPELLEVRRHRDQPLADRVVEDELILLSRAFSFLSCLGQRAQLVVPFAPRACRQPDDYSDRPA